MIFGARRLKPSGDLDHHRGLLGDRAVVEASVRVEVSRSGFRVPSFSPDKNGPNPKTQPYAATKVLKNFLRQALVPSPA
jgi:hypothetical protein